MKNYSLLILIVFVGLSSCKKEKPDINIKNDSKLATELRLSPENLSIGNNDLLLNTYIQRDFMPDSEENGRKMICVTKLTEAKGISILRTIKLKRIYVIKENEIWTANYNEIKKNVAFIYEGVVWNGPKWEPNIRVDVICEFDNLGTTYRILAKSQLINRTD